MLPLAHQSEFEARVSCFEAAQFPPQELFILMLSVSTQMDSLFTYLVYVVCLCVLSMAYLSKQDYEVK